MLAILFNLHNIRLVFSRAIAAQHSMAIPCWEIVVKTRHHGLAWHSVAKAEQTRLMKKSKSDNELLYMLLFNYNHTIQKTEDEKAHAEWLVFKNMKTSSCDVASSINFNIIKGTTKSEAIQITQTCQRTIPSGK